jgi:hypothetical protein
MFDLLFDHPPADLGLGLGHASAGLGLGQEYLLTDSDHLVEVSNSFGGTGGSGHGAGGVSPTSTLVGHAHGLEIDLTWDSSVTSAANWRAIESSVISAAEIFTTLFTNRDVLNIDVGFGEIAGSALEPGALGESESLGYIVPNDGTVDAALGAADAGLVHTHLMSPDAVTALDGVAGANFFITSADAKALGLVDPAAGLDGFIGFSNSEPISFGRLFTKASQYDAIGIAAHELSEVMGRVGLEGASLGGGFNDVYTPLDIFRYSGPHMPDVTPSAGYFSLNDGRTDLLPFNNPQNGGDGADWATARVTRDNAFDAFATTGPSFVTPVDMLTMVALGYHI